MRANTTLDKLMHRIHSFFKGPFILKLLVEHEGDTMEIRHDEDLVNAFALAQGNTLAVRLEDRYVVEPLLLSKERLTQASLIKREEIVQAPADRQQKSKSKHHKKQKERILDGGHGNNGEVIE